MKLAGMQFPLYENKQKQLQFMEALQTFYHRNRITVPHREKNKVMLTHTVCKSCMKAFALTYAYRLNADPITISKILAVPVTIGHNGFYLDEGQVKPCTPLNV